MEVTQQYKDKVIEILRLKIAESGESDATFARRFGIDTTVFSKLINKKTTNLLKDYRWVDLGQELDVDLRERKWNTAETAVFKRIKSQILFCKNNSKSQIFVDKCEIGKTYTAKYLSKTLPYCFYIDASQCKTPRLFVRELARVLGIPFRGTYDDVRKKIKYYLSRVADYPVVILDEFGDVTNNTFLELKEYWNATEHYCGWYMMGAEGLQRKIECNVNKEVVGFAEVLSRFATKVRNIVPTDEDKKIAFYRKLVADVISVNTDNKKAINYIVNKCLVKNNDQYGGLRRAESILISEKKTWQK